MRNKNQITKTINGGEHAQTTPIFYPPVSLGVLAVECGLFSCFYILLMAVIKGPLIFLF
jgi:hypothetical protein